MSHQSFFTQPPAPAGKPEDPRPLRNPSFQARISQDLLEYLTHNNFELEMKHSLTQKTLKSPTQKDFNLIFQWLYRRIDPGYRFQKGIDAEVPPILKQLRYPYEKNISKSQIAAVGGQNWSTFLGLLHWMMQLAQMMDRYSAGSYDNACAEAGVDVSGDRIVSRFLFYAYQDWLQVGPEDDDNAEEALVPHVKAMAAEFEQGNAKLAEELKIYEAENKALKSQIEELHRTAPDIEKLDTDFKVLENDKRKFEDYNTNVQAKIERYENRIKILDGHLQKTEAELVEAENERAQLQRAVDEQGLNIQDIDRMNNERDWLQKSVDDTQATLEDIGRKVLDKEMDTARKLEELEVVIKEYNSFCYELSLIPSTAANAKGESYELSLNLPDGGGYNGSSKNNDEKDSFTTSRSHRSTDLDQRILVNSTTGHSPALLLSPPDPRSTLRPSLIQLRKEISDRRKAAEESHLNSLDLLHSTSDALAEKSREVDTLAHATRLAEQAYLTVRDQSATTHTQHTTAIEKLEGELAKLRASLADGVLALDQIEMEVQVAWEAMQADCAALRDRLHRGVEAALEDVVRFKVRIQKGLEEFEDWVGAEVERELLDEEQQQQQQQ